MKVSLCSLALFLAVYAQLALTQNLIANIGKPNNNNSEPMLDHFFRLAEAIRDEYPDGEITIRRRLHARSMVEIAQGRSDFHLPLICNKNEQGTKYYDFLSERIGTVVMALYSSPNSTLTAKQLKEAEWQLNKATMKKLSRLFTDNELRKLAALNHSYRNSGNFIKVVEITLGKKLNKQETSDLIRLAYPYHIETDRLHAALLGIPAYPSTSMRNSLKKTLSGDIDGYLYAAIAVENTLNNEFPQQAFSRRFYNLFDICVVIKANSRGGKLDKKLSAIIKRLKQSPQQQQLFNLTTRQSDEWLNKYGLDQNEQLK